MWRDRRTTPLRRKIKLSNQMETSKQQRPAGSSRTTCSGSSGMLTDVETELWRMQVRVKDAGAEDAAKVLELAARIVGMSGKQAVALKAAHDLLTTIEAGSCDHPGYEAGTWLRIYGQNAWAVTPGANGKQTK